MLDCCCARDGFCNKLPINIEVKQQIEVVPTLVSYECGI